jgi:Kef-type K+ transport system membrane component KefB/nucleotide-binding universal stress UspA family protein
MSSEAGFLASIVVILFASRLMGEAAQRIGQPAVIGQLLAGILLGPSLFGLLWPAGQHAIFPNDPSHTAMLDGIAHFGVLLLLLLTGMEADLKLMRRIGRPALSVSALGVLVPLCLGVALGFVVPPDLLPDPQRRLVTALFLGVALSISSIKIVAMVVNEMNFGRRDLGQLVISSAILEDSLGWILIAVIFGIAKTGHFDLFALVKSVGGVALFLVLSLTVGRRLVAIGIRAVNDRFVGDFSVITFILLLMGTMALVTDALGVQTVLGAFVAGVLAGESPILTKHIEGQLRGMVASFFAPIFFALAGLHSDLTLLGNPTAATLTLGLVLVASLGKFGGAFLGGAIGGLTRAESFALAIGMNARGSTEVIVASIGLSIGVLTQNLYSMIVTMAVLTTCAMPPTFRWTLARIPFRPGEQQRLDREAQDAKGFVANRERFLVAAGAGPNGRLASRLAGLLAGARGQPITMLKVGRDADDATVAPDEKAAHESVTAAIAARPADPDGSSLASDVAVKASPANLPLAQTLSDEARKGHDFLIVGLDPAEARGGVFSPEVSASVRAFEGPLAVAVGRDTRDRDPSEAPLRILAPITGTANSRHAAEVAIELARAAGGPLTLLFVSAPQSSAPSSSTPSSDRRRRHLTSRNAQAAVREIVELAESRDQDVSVRTRRSENWHEAILEEATRAGATLIVLGVTARPSEALLFGETASRLLEASSRSMLLVASES